MRRSTMTVFATFFALTIPAIAMAGKDKTETKLAPIPADLAIPPALDLKKLMKAEAKRIHDIRHRQAVRKRAKKRALARRVAQRKRAEVKAAALRVAAVQAVTAPTAASSGSGTAPSGILQQIAQCESGGNPGAISSGGTYRGKYQFSRSTWNSVGGSGDPAAASEAEQDRLAAKLLATGGRGHWPNC